MRVLLILTALLSACAVPGAVERRTAHWQHFLEKSVPIGTQAETALEAMRQADLVPRMGTYVTVTSSGERRSNCRDPQKAISGREASGVRGLYARYDIEVTVCLSPDNRVEKHYVGAWNAGL